MLRVADGSVPPLDRRVSFRKATEPRTDSFRRHDRIRRRAPVRQLPLETEGSARDRDTFAGAHNLEHLLLHLEPIRSSLWGILVNENGPGMSSLRADVFHSMVSKSYLDGKPTGLELGGMPLPKLKSVDLKHHQIDPRDLLKFCFERKNTLESVKLSRIVDMDPDVEHVDFIDRIRSAIGDDCSSKDIVVESSYTGGGWFDIRW